VASDFIARILDRHHGVAWIGFLIILHIAGDMIRAGPHEVVAATRKA
jgi:predicted tellurium resistance membrane protein TerC